MNIKTKFLLSLVLLFLLYNISLAWVNTTQLKEEIRQKELAVRNNPTSPDAMFDLAITYAYTNKIEAGLETLKKTAELVKDTKTYARYLIEKYYDIVKKSPRDWRMRFRLAFAYYFGGYKDLALMELQNIANLEPKNPWPYGYMAVIKAEQENWEEAIKYMKKAIAIDYNVAAFHLGLAQAYQKTGNHLGAMLESAEAFRLRALGY